eukprot:c14476_g2_i1 orf=273-443(-)
MWHAFEAKAMMVVPSKCIEDGKQCRKIPSVYGTSRSGMRIGVPKNPKSSSTLGGSE